MRFLSNSVALLWLLFATSALVFAPCASALAAQEGASAASATESLPSPAELRFMDRPIVVFRSVVAGATPGVRAARARETLDALQESALDARIETSEATIGGTTGTVFRLGDHILFIVAHSDRDPLHSPSFDQFVDVTRTNLSGALEARRSELHWPNFLRGLLFSIAGMAVLVGLVWSVVKTRTLLQTKLQRVLEQHVLQRTTKSFDWSGTAVQLTRQIVQLIAGFLVLLFVYTYLIFVLERFPATEPAGEKLSAFLLGLLGRIGLAAAEAVPGIVTVVVIFLLTRAIQSLVANTFRAVQSGRASLPGLHEETVGATRRLVSIGIWALGITFAYPYIPGSQSDVFKGLSVLLGFMVTLGSSGIVNQLMSGIIVVYTRSLHKGDFVKIGDTTGIVMAIDTLSVRIATVRNEEVTIPNAVVVGSVIVNYTSRIPGRTSSVSVSVTIGYDAPWRQVRSMLEIAASRTPHVLSDPAPLVLQTSLSDFYIEYQLVAPIDAPNLHPRVQSDLHANVIDVFNEHGVQIMSPHFMGQPREAVIVPKDKWHAAPASDRDPARQ